MKARYIIILCIVFMAIGAGGGYALRYYTYSCPAVSEARPQDPEPPVYFRPIEVIQSSGAGIITIEGSLLAGNVFAVIAKNNLMSVTRKFDLVLEKPKVRHHAVGLGYSLMFDIDSRQFRHGLDVMYHYIWPRFSMGVGPMVQFSDSRVYQVGARIEARGVF